MIFLYNKCESDFFVPCGKSQFVEDINECLVSISHATKMQLVQMPSELTSASANQVLVVMV